MTMNFISEIKLTILRFFGWDMESTDQELHQHLNDLPQTLEEMRTSIRSEVQSQFDGRVQELEKELNAFKSGDVELRSQLEKAQARIGALEAEVLRLQKLPSTEHTQGQTDNEGFYASTQHYDPNRSSVTRKAKGLS